MVGYELGKTVTDNGSVARGVCETDANGYLTVVTERTKIEKYDGGIHFTEDDGATWTDVPAPSKADISAVIEKLKAMGVDKTEPY